MDNARSISYRLLYLLVHWFYAAFEWISRHVRNFKSHALTRAPIARVDKIPRHLTVLLGHEEPSTLDLANIILWSMAAGIAFVTFHDYKGSLNKQEDKLREAVEKRKNRSDHVIWHSSANGFSGNKIHVRVLDVEDGKNSMVQVCRKYVEQGLQDFGTNAIDRLLHDRHKFPDPDLGLYCGRTFSLYDYPPWQIRVTEFLPLNTHHGISSTTFLQLLQRYSRCEQRFGK